MAEQLRAPYEPDVDEDAPPVEELGDMTDAVVVGREWANAGAPRTVLHRVELRGCRMTGVELAESTLRDVVFADCRLDLAGFRYARLERVVFRDCRLEESDFHGAALVDVLFERSPLTGATISSWRVERVELHGCDLTGVRGAEALRGVRMPWHDVVANAGPLAAAVGVEILDEN